MNEGLEDKLWRLLQGFSLSLVLILSGYLCYQIFGAGRPNLAVGEERKESQNLEESFLKNARSWDEYRDRIQKRDLFEASLEKKDSPTQNAVNLSALTKDLKLIGIVLDQKPQAVIKDLKTNQTVFLNQGEKIQEVTVAEILEGKVILNYQDQKVELVQ